jgi:cellulose biosynthesis protein BcsQ
MSKIYVDYSHKGGCLKTTTSVSVAFRAMERNIRLGFLDLDPQGNGMRWLSGNTWDKNSSVDTLHLGSIVVSRVLADVEREPFILIDTKPDASTFDAITSKFPVDAWLIPFMATDIYEYEGAADVVKSVKERDLGGRIIVIPTKTTSLEPFAKQHLSSIAELPGVEFCPYSIPNSSIALTAARSEGVAPWKASRGLTNNAAIALKAFADYVLDDFNSLRPNRASLQRFSLQTYGNAKY